MSSSSYSECDSCECSHCTYSFENNHNDYVQCMTNSRHVPIYAAMAQPLIYYAQVQPPNRRQNDQPKKENPFKKAFKWYTQERKAVCCENEVGPERSGFASWLDNKYSEYLRESGQQPTSNQPWATQGNTCQCPKPTKKFRRFKSPWRKRPCPANDSGDVPQKCPDGSCEYILKPKEMSRAASEVCYHSPTGKSNATIESSQSPCNAKYSRRSQSLSDVSREKYVHKHVETVPLTVQEGTYISCECPQQVIVYPPLKQREQGCDCQQEKVPEAVQVPSQQQDPRYQPETPCSCQKEKLPDPMQIKSCEQESRNQSIAPCTCQNEKEPEILKEQLDSKNQPGPPCSCQTVKVPGIVKEQDAMNQPRPPSTRQTVKVPDIVKETRKERHSISQPGPPCSCQTAKVPGTVEEQHSMNQPVAPCSRERASVVVIVQPKEQDAENLPAAPRKCSQEKVPIVGKLPSCHKETPQSVEAPQDKNPEVAKVPSKAQETMNDQGPCCKCIKEKVPKVVQVPSNERDHKSLLGSCCSCHVKKVPEVVQVPSQCRAVEESCQFPEQKVAPMCQETQYEPAPTPLRSWQKLGPCCCKICTPAHPPQPLQPQIFCLPVKIKSSKTSSPDMCRTVAPSVQCPSPKKPKKVKQFSVATVTSQCCEEIKPKASQCQPQSDPNEGKTQCMPEICLCGKENPSSNNCCYEERQVFGPIPVKRESFCSVAVNKETGEYSIMKEVAVSNKLTRCVTCASHGAAQTSDHSIRFEKDGACNCPYPVYFKIIYPDVAKNEGCK